MNTRLRFMASMAAVLAAMFFGGCSTPGVIDQVLVRPRVWLPGGKDLSLGRLRVTVRLGPAARSQRAISFRIACWRSKGFTKADPAALSIAIRYDSSGYSA